ncbi:Uncharacterised protein [uncultured archaeon]|nr:Uncharacterised protein [uncultured archaeon]
MAISPNLLRTIEPTHAAQIEALLEQLVFPVARNTVVCPNISHGFFRSHESDLVCVSKAGWLTEVEIKVSASDWKNDRKKSKWQSEDDAVSEELYDRRVRRFFFAAPLSLARRYQEFNIMLFAGVLGFSWEEYQRTGSPYCVPRVEHIRPAKDLKGSRKVTDKELLTLSKLSSMRYWGLRQAMSGNPYNK